MATENPQHNIYWKNIGIPSTYWPSAQVLPPVTAFTCECEKGIFKQEDQEHYFKWLCDLNLPKRKKPFCAILASSPTDTSALQAAAYIVKEIVKRTPHIVNEVRFINLAEVEIKPDMKWDDNALVVAYGVGTNSTQHRLQVARDLMSVCHKIPFILVASGTNPIDFCITYLKSHVDLPVYFRDINHIKRILQKASKVVTV